MSFNVVSVPSPRAAVHGAARSIYVFMAVLFVVVAVVGFAPRSIAILTGARPVPPLLIHVHAALMASWLLLLLAQTSLMAAGRARLHRALGAASFVLAPAMFVAMTALIAVNYLGLAAAASAPDAQVPMIAASRAMAFFLFVMGRAALLFGVFYLWAVLSRRSAPATHKRLMVLATFVVIDAALGRMTWLPGSAHGNWMAADYGYDGVHLYHLLLLAPALIHDLVRFGRVHSAYLIGLGLYLPFVLATHFAWNSAGWQRVVGAMLGVG
ncbi:MAG TPA: hypothetical protein VF322_10565 [Gammaproteobacteria bacterium]